MQLDFEETGTENTKVFFVDSPYLILNSDFNMELLLYYSDFTNKLGIFLSDPESLF